MFQVTFPEVARVLQTLQLVGGGGGKSRLPVRRAVHHAAVPGGELARRARARTAAPTRPTTARRCVCCSPTPCAPCAATRWSSSCCCPTTTLRSWSAPTALSQWCQGFLYGFGTGGAGAARASCRGEVEEVLRDLTHISQASVETGADAEEEEAGLRGDRRVRARRRAADPRRAARARASAGDAGDAPDPSRLN